MREWVLCVSLVVWAVTAGVQHSVSTVLYLSLSFIPHTHTHGHTHTHTHAHSIVSFGAPVSNEYRLIVEGQVPISLQTGQVNSTAYFECSLISIHAFPTTNNTISSHGI